MLSLERMGAAAEEPESIHPACARDMLRVDGLEVGIGGSLYGLFRERRNVYVALGICDPRLRGSRSRGESGDGAESERPSIETAKIHDKNTNRIIFRIL